MRKLNKFWWDRLFCIFISRKLLEILELIIASTNVRQPYPKIEISNLFFLLFSFYSYFFVSSFFLFFLFFFFFLLLLFFFLVFLLLFSLFFHFLLLYFIMLFFLLSFMLLCSLQDSIKGNWMLEKPLVFSGSSTIQFFNSPPFPNTVS